MAGKAGRAKISKKQFKEHLPNSSCSYTQLSKLLGCHRYTLRGWLVKHPDMQKLFEEQKEFMIGEAEDVIYEDIVINRDGRRAEWYLKVMTDKYTDKKQEIEVSGELGLNINIIDSKNDDEDE